MKRILFICGSLNQTKMMYEISLNLQDYECYFSPLYTDGFLEIIRKLGLLNFTPLGGNHKKNTEYFLAEKKVKVDYKGRINNYELVFLSSDLTIQKNIKNKKKILVQEGMTDPENLIFKLVRYLRLPRYLASTSTAGLSREYEYFCVASEGYKHFFIQKGIRPDKIIVTGIPNYDDLDKYRKDNTEFKNFVLVATSDARETFKFENRRQFILDAVKIANGKNLVFKLHPNENYTRAKKEIAKYAPNSIVFTDCDINNLIASCDVLITQYSTVVYTGIALGKEVHSYFDIEELKKLCPIQNNGTSGFQIAAIGRKLIEDTVNEKNQPNEVLLPRDNDFELIFNYD